MDDTLGTFLAKRVSDMDGGELLMYAIVVLVVLWFVWSTFFKKDDEDSGLIIHDSMDTESPDTAAPEDTEETDFIYSRTELCEAFGALVTPFTDVVMVEYVGDCITLTHSDDAETIVRPGPNSYLIAEGKDSDPWVHGDDEEATELIVLDNGRELFRLSLYESNLWDAEWQGDCVISGEKKDGTQVDIVLGSGLTLIYK